MENDVYSYFAFQVTCPECKKTVSCIARHMRSVHKWSASKARYTRAHLNILVRKNPQRSPLKRQRPLKNCPFRGCEAKVSRLSQHIKYCHNEELRRKENSEFFRQIVDCFERWMKSPDAGGLTPLTVTRQVSQVTKIFHTLPDFQSLLDEVIVSELFQKKVESKDWEASTACTYLFALNSFYKFLATTYFETTVKASTKLLPLPVEEVKRLALILKESSLRWTKTYRKMNASTLDTKYVRDQNNILTREERMKCKYGRAFKQVKLLMKEYASHEQADVSPAHFITIRNYLLLNIFIRNAHRACVAMRMKVDHFRNAKKTDGKYLIEIDDHKTQRTYGNATIIVDPSFFRIMTFYLDRVRPACLHTNASPWFFISREGAQMDGSGVNHAIKICAKSCGVTKEVSTTLLRKYAATAVDCDNRADLSKLMLHSEETSRRYYDRKDKQLARLRGEEILNTLECVSDSSDDCEGENYCEENSINDELDENGADLSLNDANEISMEARACTSSSVRKSAIICENFENDTTSDHLLDSSDGFHVPEEVNENFSYTDVEYSSIDNARVRKFNETDNTHLLEIFQDFIAGKAKLKINSIKTLLQNSAPYLLKKFTISQLSSRIRYMKVKATNK